MMKSQEVHRLRERFYRAGWQGFCDLLEQNYCQDLVQVAGQIAMLLAAKLIDNLQPPEFEKFKRDRAFSNNLTAGDQFYFNLFSKAGIVSKLYGEDSKTALTRAVQSVYEELFFEHHASHEGHIVYGLLADLIRVDIGMQLGRDKRLNSYEEWEEADKFLRTQNTYKIYTAWENTLPTSLFLKELSKFAEVPAGTKLSEMATLDFSPRETLQSTENYLAQLAEISGSLPLKYVQESTLQSDSVHLTRKLLLRQRLTQKAGMQHWVHFLDSLRYPILQDHLFSFIEEIDSYPLIIEILNSATVLGSSKTHLILIALQNYFEFCKATLMALEDISEERMSHEEQRICISEAQNLKNHFTDEAIPVSFNRILDILLSSVAPEEGDLFISVFDWINSHTKLHITTIARRPEANLIDLLNNLYETKLMAMNTDFLAIINNLSPQQIGWECLQKLVGVVLNDMTNTALRDGVCTMYTEFVSKPGFSFSATHMDAEVAINNAYYFSQLLGAYDTAFEKWSSLYETHRTSYQGWKTNFWDYGQSSREAYLLCVGMGIAYWYFVGANKEKGAQVVTEVFAIILLQLRSRDEHSGSAEYSAALKFQSITIGLFCSGKADDFVLSLAKSVDSVKLFLVVVYELSTNHQISKVSDAAKQAIRLRLDEEFWLIKRKYEDISNNEYLFYLQLKDAVVQRLNSNNESIHLFE